MQHWEYQILRDFFEHTRFVPPAKEYRMCLNIKFIIFNTFDILANLSLSLSFKNFAGISYLHSYFFFEKISLCFGEKKFFKIYFFYICLQFLLKGAHYSTGHAWPHVCMNSFVCQCIMYIHKSIFVSNIK